MWWFTISREVRACMLHKIRIDYILISFIMGD